MLFENVEGSDIPVAINTFGSYWRMNQALGTNEPRSAGRARAATGQAGDPHDADGEDEAPAGPDEDGQLSAESRPERDLPAGRAGRRARRPDATADHSMLAAGRRPGKRARFRRTPPPRQAADRQTGTGRYITLAASTRENPDTGDRNIGMYRVQLFGPRLCAMHWHMHHDGARHFRKYQKPQREDAAGDRPRRRIGAALRRHCPAAAGHRRAALRRLPQWRRHRAGQVRTIDLRSPRQRRDRHRRLRRSARRNCWKAPSAITPASIRWPTGIPRSTSPRSRMRKNPIYPDHDRRQAADGRLFPRQGDRAHLPAAAEDARAGHHRLRLPISGVFHNCAFVKIRKEYPFQARRVMHAIWGAGQMSFTKFIIVVDEHVNVHDEQDVLFHLFANCDPARDTRNRPRPGGHPRPRQPRTWRRQQDRL